MQFPAELQPRRYTVAISEKFIAAFLRAKYKYIVIIQGVPKKMSPPKLWRIFI